MQIIDKAKSYFLGRHPAAIILMIVAIALVLIGVVYTGYHTHSLFTKQSDNPVIAFAAVAVFEGSLLMGMFCSMFWPMNSMQKVINMIFGVVILGILTFNTLADVGYLETTSTVVGGLMVGAFIMSIAYWKYFIINDDVSKANSEKFRIMEEVALARVELEALKLQSQINDERNKVHLQNELNDRLYLMGRQAISDDDFNKAAYAIQAQQSRQNLKLLTGMIGEAGYDNADYSTKSRSAKGHFVSDNQVFKSHTVNGHNGYSIRFKKSGNGVVLWFREGKTESYGAYVSREEYNVLRDSDYPTLAKFLITRVSSKPELLKKIKSTV